MVMRRCLLAVVRSRLIVVVAHPRGPGFIAEAEAAAERVVGIPRAAVAEVGELRDFAVVGIVFAGLELPIEVVRQGSHFGQPLLLLLLRIVGKQREDDDEKAKDQDGEH
jgi:hypothetical protein